MIAESSVEFIRLEVESCWSTASLVVTAALFAVAAARLLAAALALVLMVDFFPRPLPRPLVVAVGRNTVGPGLIVGKSGISTVDLSSGGAEPVRSASLSLVLLTCSLNI